MVELLRHLRPAWAINMKKLLITGISGFVGWHVAGFRQKMWRLTGLYNTHAFSSDRIPTHRLDFLHADNLLETIQSIRPDGIMHLAAISSPLQCAERIDASYRINVVVPTLLAEYCQEKNIPFVFASSDMVFDGTRPPYGPHDYTSPVNVYGKEKAEAEQRILQIYRDATIARLPLLYGFSPMGTNFMQKWLNTWTRGQLVTAFSDEIRSMVSVQDAVEGLFLLLNKRLAHIWHLGGLQAVSRQEFAEALADTFSFSHELIQTTTIAQAGVPERRPRNLTLNSQLTYDLGYYPRPLSQSLEELRKYRSHASPF